MKTTTRIAACLIAVALALSASRMLATTWGAAAHCVGSASVGQIGSAIDPKAQATDLLKRARQLMNNNDFDGAESLIAQAERLNVSYGMFAADTPVSARKALAQKRNGGRRSLLPSRIQVPFLSRNNTKSPSDPFSGRPTTAVANNLTDETSLVRSLVQKGERSLAEGNMVAAEHWYRQAAKLEVAFAPGRDPRATLAARIQAQGGNTAITAAVAGSFGPNDITPLPNPSFVSAPGNLGTATPEPFGRAMATSPPAGPTGPLPNALAAAPPVPARPLPSGNYVPLTPPASAAGSSMATDAGGTEVLLEARRALAGGDIARATGLVHQARRMQAQFDPRGDTPADVENAIREYQHVASQPRQGEAYRRAYAKMLVKQSQALLAAGDLDLAEELADKASRQQIAFGPLEVTPAALLSEIGSVRRQSRGPARGLAASSVGTGPPSAMPDSSDARQQAAEYTRKARVALEAGQFDFAEQNARRAQQFGLPDTAFVSGEQPGMLLLDIRRQRAQAASRVVPANAVVPATGYDSPSHVASRAVYNPATDPTRNLPAAAASPAGDTAYALYQKGVAALRAHDKQQAYQYFSEAAQRRHELDSATAQSVQGFLQNLTTPMPNPNAAPPAGLPAGDPATDPAASQQAFALQLGADVNMEASKAKVMREQDPNGALALLGETRQRVESAGVDSTTRDHLLRRIDREVAETKQFIEMNRPRLELAERNQATQEAWEREQRLKIETQGKFALLVDDFNRLVDEQRFAEAELVAKRAEALDPENPIAHQMVLMAKAIRRVNANLALQEAKENAFWTTMHRVGESAIGIDPDNPIQYPDAATWEELSGRRRQLLERASRLNERELEIQQKLTTPVSLDFTEEPLANVLEYLSKLTEVNMHLDPQGMNQEMVSSDSPVTITVPNEIMLKSALNLILRPLHLGYVIKDEVLMITSEQGRDTNVYTVMYPVGDLVIGIPNFVPGSMGLQSAYNQSMANVGYGVGGIGGGFGGGMAAPTAVMAANGGAQASITPAVAAHMGGGNVPNTIAAQQMGGSSPRSGVAGQPIGFGPGGLGGAANADFDSLIELITSTVAPTTWDEVGGAGSVKEFPTNLSIVVSQTQDVHEEIVDLLEQLRRMQDLQVTIEVRFITLNDNFFERIGVDFDFDIDDDIDRPFQVFGREVPGVPGDPATGQEPARNTLDVDHDRSAVVGMGRPGVFSADLDIPFTQNSFSLAVPQFGGFDAAAGAQLGFAILSDIEAFFFINAAQGDRRSNVLQAPKVTLFNGQQAYVSDTSQSPFVISVIPVVGDFAAAQQPVIVVLSEGTFMTVQAVVSNDRRFVRLTVVPFFSKITDVQTFQFTGSQTTTTDASADSGIFADALDPDNDRRDNVTSSSNSTTTSNGTTVQLPTFSFVTVTTTVSVPDGGTVLLGGIKRLSEGRNEFGVPILNKLPYINRLFKNVGIGRETQSLMMMVTPRIIIQEEEEANLGILSP